MSSKQTTKPDVLTAEMRRRFGELADRWIQETMYLSSTTEMTAHPAFVEIVGMGEAVIPLVLREMDRGTGHWDLAMTRIARFNPVPLEERGKVSLAAKLWLEWGREQGYRW